MASTEERDSQVVWSWLVQVGLGKAGFYSNDLLDNVGHPCTDHVRIGVVPDG